MKRKVDIETWNRKEHFKFFGQFEEPYHGVCVNIDCTAGYRFAKDNGVSFFLYYVYQSLSAAHIVEPFKYRWEGDDVFIYDKIDAGTTIGRSNGTFGFSHINYSPSFEEYIAGANQEVKRVQDSTLLERNPAGNVIRYSALPWIDFTALSHARMFSFRDTCPKISFGKMTESNGKKTMPVSIHVHHALVDGLHVGQYINCYQELMQKGI